VTPGYLNKYKMVLKLLVLTVRR